MRRRPSAAAAVGILIGLGLLGGGARAATITVTTTADDVATNGNCTLREAVIAATQNAPQDACPAGGTDPTIVLPAGTYTLAIPGVDESSSRTGDLDLYGPLTIAGAGAAGTVIDGGGLDRVFTVFGGTVIVSGVTIRGGDARRSGCSCGGGIRLLGGTLVLSESMVSANTAWTGAGIDVNGVLQANDVTVSGNTAASDFYDGGGIRTEPSGSAALTNVTISGNLAWRSGGGIANGGTMSLDGVTVADNLAGSDGNPAGSAGGVLNVGTASFTLANTLLAGNAAPSHGPDDCAGALVSQGYNLLGTPAGCTLGAVLTGDVLGQDPHLLPLADNGGGLLTHALDAASPALNAGNPAAPGSGGAACPGTDERGIPRPQLGRCDIGALEAVSITTTTLPGCGEQPTFATVDCRLNALRTATDAAVSATGFRHRLDGFLTRAVTRTAHARQLDARGKTRAAGKVLGRAGRLVGGYADLLRARAGIRLGPGVTGPLGSDAAELRALLGMLRAA